MIYVCFDRRIQKKGLPLKTIWIDLFYLLKLWVGSLLYLLQFWVHTSFVHPDPGNSAFSHFFCSSQDFGGSYGFSMLERRNVYNFTEQSNNHVHLQWLVRSAEVWKWASFEPFVLHTPNFVTFHVSLRPDYTDKKMTPSFWRDWGVNRMQPGGGYDSRLFTSPSSVAIWNS